VGDAVVIGSNCLHNAPGVSEGRVVLFGAIRNTPKTALPWKKTDNNIDGDIQWMAASLFLAIFSEYCCLLSDTERHTLIVIFGWYLVLGMCQGNPLGGNFVDFPCIQSYITDLEVLYKKEMKGVEKSVKSGRDWFHEDGTAKDFARKLFLGIPDVAESHKMKADFLETEKETHAMALMSEEVMALTSNKRPR
jgi:hypothetical protein